jgi:hypothetical protein
LTIPRGFWGRRRHEPRGLVRLVSPAHVRCARCAGPSMRHATALPLRAPAPAHSSKNSHLTPAPALRHQESMHAGDLAGPKSPLRGAGRPLRTPPAHDLQRTDACLIPARSRSAHLALGRVGRCRAACRSMAKRIKHCDCRGRGRRRGPLAPVAECEFGAPAHATRSGGQASAHDALLTERHASGVRAGEWRASRTSLRPAGTTFATELPREASSEICW